MITRSELSVQTIEDFDSWQEQLANAVNVPQSSFLAMLGLDQKNFLPGRHKGKRRFLIKKYHKGLLAEWNTATRMTHCCGQVLPIGEECLQVGTVFGIDPLAETRATIR